MTLAPLPPHHLHLPSTTAHDLTTMHHPIHADELPPEFSALRHVNSLVDSLISSSHSPRCFTGKWQSIRAKLDLLRSGLASASASATATLAASSSSIGNLVLRELLQDIAATVNETHELCQSCAYGSFPGGRLLMLSNLDLVVAKLELHSKSLTGLYSSGILTRPDAIVASKPPSGASHEDVRFYMKDLCARMRVGNSEAKSRALAALNEVLGEDERFVRIAAGETPELLGILVASLEIRDVGIQQQAAEAVSVLSCIDSCRQLLTTAGAVPALIQIMDNGSELGKESAGRALKKLTENSENAWSVSAHGGVTLLLQICWGDMEESAELIGSACGILKNLLPVPEIRSFMLEQGMISVLIKLLRSGEDVARIQAMELLQCIVNGDKEARSKALQEGAAEALVRILDPACRFSTSKTREAALRAIEALCFNSGNSVNTLMKSGFLERVLLLLRSGEISVQESALKAASCFCSMSEEARKTMGEVGFMPELLKLLNAQSIGVREMAASALSSIVSVHRNQRRFVEEEENVNRILQVLNRSEEKPVTRKFLLTALMSLSDSNAGRKKIVASGYMNNLEKMAESEASDAKRIVKKLSGGRLRSLLHSFWGN